MAVAVYVISRGPDGPCKIGRSRDPEQRVVTLQVASPERLHIEAVFWFSTEALAHHVENRLHAVFDGSRLCGEWFAWSPWHLLTQIPSYLDVWGFDS